MAKLWSFSKLSKVKVKESDKDSKKAAPVKVAVTETKQDAPALEEGPKLTVKVIDEQLRDELATADENSVLKLVDLFVEHAHQMHASDLHFDPQPDGLRVRLRVDGVLQESLTIPKQLNNPFISRIKILSGLRTDEHQAAQDGRFRYTTQDGVPIDVRVSIAPTYHGENAVLRLLVDQQAQYTLSALGFSEENQAKLHRAIRKPYGMILATGPTGSGKTTTLYTILKLLNTPDVSIVTIEDPVEYAIEGIEQIPVNDRTNLTFSSGLRSILRQDPNIIMVGEVRDQETAGLAINTALTGHLVLTTLHTNDAATTLPRLLDLKIEPYLIGSTVNVAIGQRLVRKICEGCKTSYEPSEVELKSIEHFVPKGKGKKHEFYRGKGCDACNQTGYSGRVGIHEVIEVDKPIREAILEKQSSAVIKEIAINNGMTTMVQDGLAKAAKGITTVEEVLRTLYD
jgi:type IV pilus assembly protein PilB